MLVVHPSSTCDVCLDRFSDDRDQAPHSIPCGHVFCRRCLTNITPRTCPLCRRNFQIERARKLHIDMTGILMSPRPPPPTAEELEIKELEQRVAEACMEGVSNEECREIIEQVQRWLGTKPLDFCAEHKLLHQTVILLHRFKRLQEKYAGAKKTIEGVKRQLKKTERHRDHDRTMTEVVAESYESRIAEVHQEYSQKIESLTADNLKLTRQLQEYSQPISRPNPLPPPPQPVPYENLPEYARPHASAPIGEEYFRELERYKQGSKAALDYGYDYDYNAYSSTRSRDRGAYYPDYSHSLHGRTTDYSYTGNGTKTNGESSTTPTWWANLNSKPSMTLREQSAGTKDLDVTPVSFEEFGERVQRHFTGSQNQSHGLSQRQTRHSNDAVVGSGSTQGRMEGAHIPNLNSTTATPHDHNQYIGNSSHLDNTTSVPTPSLPRHHSSSVAAQHSHTRTHAHSTYPRVTEDGMLESRVPSSIHHRDEIETPLARPETVTVASSSIPSSVSRETRNVAATRAAMASLNLNVNPTTSTSPLPAPIPARIGTKHHVFLQDSISTPTLVEATGSENVTAIDGERQTQTVQRVVRARSSLSSFSPDEAQPNTSISIPTKVTPGLAPILRSQTSTSSLLSNHSGRSISRDEAQRLLLDDLVHDSSRGTQANSGDTVPHIPGSLYPGGYTSSS